MKSIVYFGSSRPSAEILAELADSQLVTIKAVVTQGRKAGAHHHQQDTPVAQAAQQLGLPLLTPARAVDAIPELTELEADAGLLFAYGQILPDELLAIFPKGIVNIHPSLLPLHRGPSPIEATILAGDTTAGTSLMLITSAMDAGPIIAQRSFPLAPTTTKAELTAKLITTSRDLLHATLPDYLAGKISPRTQDESRASYCPLLTKDSGLINPHNASATTIERQVRAYAGWPGAQLAVNRPGESPARLKLHEVSLRPAPDTALTTPSLICSQDQSPHQLVLRLPDGDVIIKRAQLPNRSIVTGTDLCNSGGLELSDSRND